MGSITETMKLSHEAKFEFKVAMGTMSMIRQAKVYGLKGSFVRMGKMLLAAKAYEGNGSLVCMDKIMIIRQLMPMG